MLRILFEIGRFIPGFMLFPFMFIHLRRYFRIALQEGTDIDTDKTGGSEWGANTIAIRLVSAINALFLIVVGTVTVYTTWDDIKYDRSPVLESYVYMCLPYMMYDLWAMFLTYQSEQQLRQKRTLRQSLGWFYRDNTLMVWHHIFIGAILCPVYLYFLNGIGDFVIGIFCLAELSTPFLSFRVIMKQLKFDMPTLSLANDIIFTVLFFVCRVLMMPFCYWCVGRYFKIPFLSVPFFIPIKCNFMSAVLWGMQLYWFYKIFKKMVQIILRFRNRSTTHHKENVHIHVLGNGKTNGHEHNLKYNHND